MALGLWVFLGWMIIVILSGVGFLIWGWRRGQFKDVEQAKYRMLEEREPQGWPGRESETAEEAQDD